MNLENWDALAAVASINKACEALHTGKDGISKTWSEVAVHADVLLNKKNGRQKCPACARQPISQRIESHKKKSTQVKTYAELKAF
jgi:hypothetical protein